MVLSIKYRNGFTLIEAMLSMALLLLLSLGSVSANRLATTAVTINELRSGANTLAVQGAEALLSVRADNFLGLSPGTYHPFFDGTKWALVSGQETVGKFTRSIVLKPVMRSLTCFSEVCDITTAGGVTDDGSLTSEVKVSWKQSGQQKEIVLSSLITYWR